MSTTRPYTTTNTSNTKTYEDINDILKRVSNRTLEMKTNNVKLLNKIGSEMNNLLIKCQDIVRFCINDRNGSRIHPFYFSNKKKIKNKNF